MKRNHTVVEIEDTMIKYFPKIVPTEGEPSPNPKHKDISSRHRNFFPDEKSYYLLERPDKGTG